MSTPNKVLALANRDSELNPLRRVLKGRGNQVKLVLVRSVAETLRELEKGGCVAALFTSHVSPLHQIEALSELHRRDPLLPVLLVAGTKEATGLLELAKPGVAAVVFTEVLQLLPSLLEREIHRYRTAAEQLRRFARVQWLDEAMAAAPIALAVANQDGVLRWANAAYRELAGLTSQHVEQGRARLWETGEDRWSEVHAVLNAGRIWRGSAPAVEGGLLHQICIGECARTGGEPLYIVARQVETAATADTPERIAAAQRHELFAAIAGGIAHDLNNILSPITMAANILGEQELSEENTELIRSIEHSAERGAAVIRQVLTFARGSENCEMELQPRYLVREVSRLAAEIFPAELSVRAELPANLWSIVGDPAEIHQAIVNVLLNARDAMPEGGNIAISAHNRTLATVPASVFFNPLPGDYVEICVEDDGPGVDPEVVSRAWEPFVTTKGSGQGAGLGLSRVAGVLRSHGGFGQITSKGGHGTKIGLFFPRGTAVSSTGLVEEVPAAHEGLGRILVVDDEDEILKLSRRILERAGYEVLVASEGREALGVFMRHRTEIGLVITDLAMPGMNGFTLIWALRRAKPDLRVLVATGQGTEANLRELEQMGVREVLLKPFTSRRLLDAITSTLAEPVQCEPELFLGSAVANDA
ncbi:MAG: response regulator [Opitutaceae bacterium]